MTEQTYTLEQIKAAFWREFHGAGELWFEYRGEKESSDATESGWESFLEELEKERVEPLPLDPLPNAYVAGGSDVSLDTVSVWRGASWDEIIEQSEGGIT